MFDDHVWTYAFATSNYALIAEDVVPTDVLPPIYGDGILCVEEVLDECEVISGPHAGMIFRSELWSDWSVRGTYYPTKPQMLEERQLYGSSAEPMPF